MDFTREDVARALQGKQIFNRGMVVPRVEYDDGSQGWGVPGLLMEPIEAWQRLQAGAGENVARMTSGLPFDPQSAGDAFSVAGSAALGSVAAPKPTGAYVTSGAPLREGQSAARWYHGTPASDFDRFDLKAVEATGEPDIAIAASSRPEIASKYAASGAWIGQPPAEAYKAGSRVLPLDLGFKNPMTVSQRDWGSRFANAQLIEEAKRLGHDGLILEYTDPAYAARYGEPLREALAWEPGTVRSATTGEQLYASPKEAAALNSAIEGQKQGIRAYHGSPHDFDRFDISKIGTGEGAQAYGPGLYFAEAEDVAKQYKNAGTSMAEAYARTVLEREGSPEAALASLRSPYSLGTKLEADAAKLIESGVGKSRMYEVRIKADPEDFLDWDAPLSGQSENVKRAIEAGVGEKASDSTFRRMFLDSGKGEGLLGALAGPGYDTASATAKLREAGIPGIKYLDGNSRTAGSGSRNYVVFDDKLIDIVKKYGIAGGMSLLGLSQSLGQDQQENSGGL